MCVDYRTINNLTIKDAYALPMIDDILTYVGNRASVLITLDLFSGYHCKDIINIFNTLHNLYRTLNYLM